MFKRLLAFWGKVCPACAIGRKWPNSFIGRIVRWHWDKGCPCHKAYLEIQDRGKGPP